MKNYFKALAGFQQECPVLLKDTDGYGYKYVDLTKIIHSINPLMQKHGLGFTQKLGTNPETNQSSLTTTIFHVATGESDSATVDIPLVELKGQNLYQAFGSGTTYFRRYALSSQLGIISDKDLDAYGEQISSAPVPVKKETPDDFDLLVRIANHHQKGKSLDEIYTNMIKAYPELKDSTRLTKIKNDYNEQIKASKPNRKAKKR